MSISRIGEVQAKEGLINELREFLISIMPGIRASEGCEGIHLYQSENDPTKFMMIEVWDSAESHRASVNNIPPEKLGEIQPLLATSPSGNYYRMIR
jgi:quinol monooxygenase YgiN